MTTTAAKYKADIVPVPAADNPGGLKVTVERVTTIVVDDEAGHEIARGVIGETDGIMSVKMVTGMASRLSIAQMDALEALVVAWRKNR